MTSSSAASNFGHGIPSRQTTIDLTNLLDATVEEWVEDGDEHCAPKPYDGNDNPGNEELLDPKSASILGSFETPKLPSYKTTRINVRIPSSQKHNENHTSAEAKEPSVPRMSRWTRKPRYDPIASALETQERHY